MRKRKPERGDSERTCIVTGSALAPDAMIRFVRDPGGVAVADLAGKLPGRGAWVSCRRGCVETAASKRLFSRAFREETTVGATVTPADFAESVGRSLRERALSALGLARRAGVAAAGFDLASAALRAGEAAVAFVASEAGGDGAVKIARLAGDVPLVAAFSSAELSAALGKPGLVYVALRDGHEARRALAAAERLLRYQADQPV